MFKEGLGKKVLTSSALDFQYTLLSSAIWLEGIHQRRRHREDRPLPIGQRACRGAGGRWRVDNALVGGFDGWAICRSVQRSHVATELQMNE
jgi:hypothetical protein